METLESKIESRFQDFIVPGSKVVKIKARKLITRNRFDLLIKLAYLDLKDSNKKYAQKIYDSHILAFGDGRYIEPEKPYKKDLKSFLSEFQNIYESMKVDGFDCEKSLIPLARDGSILNGAHRLACAIKLNLEVKCIRLDLPPSNYGYEFLEERGVGWPTIHSAIEALHKYEKNTRAAIIWPVKHKETLSLLSEKVQNVYYQDKVKVTLEQVESLVRQVYRNESWIGSPKDGYKGCLNKAKNCLGENSELELVIFRIDEGEDIIEVKADIREKLQAGKHCIHVSDGIEDSNFIWPYLININFHKFSLLEDKTNSLKKDQRVSSVSVFFQDNGLSKSQYCITSGFVMELLGVRETSDLDVMFDSEVITESQLLECELRLDFDNNKYQVIGLASEDIIYDPVNYFQYFGVKIVSVDVLRKFKEKRYKDERRIKDSLDLKYLSSLNKNNSLRNHALYTKVKIYMFNRRLLYACKSFMRSFLERFGLLNTLKKILRRP